MSTSENTAPVRRKMLVVEDSFPDVMLVKLALEETGAQLEVVHLADGQEMMEHMARESSADTAFVLLDLNIPKASGLDILRQKSQNAEWRTMPVILFSSSTREDDIRNSFQNGASAYVCKPVDFNEFNTTIHRIVHFWGQTNLLPRG